jgi:TolB-like protein/DNA-binding winged helix-turn-helix (wHTH) protein/Flp pilus assembly protein TadD
MQTASGHIYEFDGFQLDPAKRLLRRLDGTPVPLTPRAFDTLVYMVEHHDSVLDKERIMEAVWPDSIVEENNLAQAISKLRQVFGETPGSHSYIVTVPGRGYRFVAEVKERTGEAVKNETANGRMGETARLQPTISVTPKSQDATDTGATTEVADSPIRRFAVSGAKRTLPAKTGWLWAVAFLAVAIVGFAVVFFVRQRAPSSSVHAGTTISAATPIPEKSVAVLPFDNLSDDKQNAYFAAGVQDEITSNLARIAELKVISRTSANLYKSGSPRNSREIGQQLGVAHLLEGSVQRLGNRVRVNAQLIKAPTDAHVWAQTYDRDESDLFAIQSEIAKAIAGQLHAKISPVEKLAIERPPTTDLTAFDLYTRAKDLFVLASQSNSAKKDLLESADLLNQAVAQDTSFFQAYCQLAYTHDVLYFYGHDHIPARLALAEWAIQAAFRLRPDAGEAHLARAENLYHGYLDYDGALRELEIARPTLPNDARVFELRGYIERRRGRWDESMRNLERAVDLDPRNVVTLQQVASSYRALRRYAEEKSAYDRSLAIEPDDLDTKVARAQVELAWKADARPLHQSMDEIRAKDPAGIQSVAVGWMVCALAERDPAAAAHALAALGDNTVGDEAVRFSPRFLQGLVARMTKDDDKARSAFTAARLEQEKIVQAQPNYGPPLVVLGLIDAALGRKEEALREGRRAVELLPVEKDAINGPLMIGYLAVIAAWVGDKDLACEQLAAAIRYPSSLSYGKLKLLPFWDPLRGDPRFEKIVASLAPNEGRIGESVKRRIRRSSRAVRFPWQTLFRRFAVVSR